ncbi:MAG: hypothetical protein WDZ35_15975 [Crocinitomicaceae bacterium]
MLDGASPYSTQDFEKALHAGMIDWMNEQPFLCVFDHEPTRLDSSEINKKLSKKVKIKSLNPNNFIFELNGLKDKWVLFNHNTYPRWRFYWNGNLLEKKVVRDNFIYTKIPDSKGQLNITFYAKDIKVLFYISAISFCLLSIYLLIRFVKINIM